MKKIIFISILFGSFYLKAQSISSKFDSWQNKDWIEDSIPGTSLNRAYRELLHDKKSTPITIAVIDMAIDIHDKKLEKYIWSNQKEIPNNSIDDDSNGYVDDIHGWNFLGNDIIKANLETVRIIRKYDSLFKDKEPYVIPENLQQEYKVYLEALRSYHHSHQEALKKKKHSDYLIETYPKSKRYLKKIFPKEDYTVAQLDSILKILKKQDDSVSHKLAYYMRDYLKYNFTKKGIQNLKKINDEKLSKILNLNYNERETLKANDSDFNDISYGSNKVNANAKILTHGTLISGVIANTLEAISEEKDFYSIKIMSGVVAAYGDEHDKDIALAIRYAVDNGAKVINMSFGKDFSLHKEWVYDALQYAEKKDVLIVSSAGNSGVNLDTKDNYFVNDVDYEAQKEIVNNFMLIGESMYYKDHRLKSKKSNYGKEMVDIFAPGYALETIHPNRNPKEVKVAGTSFSSAVVSTIAALIRSYYPSLTANQVKQLLMDSGTSFENLEVEVKHPNKEIEMIPFSELSKSGKIINAYNAFQFAQKISKQQ